MCCDTANVTVKNVPHAVNIVSRVTVAVDASDARNFVKAGCVELSSTTSTVPEALSTVPPRKFILIP